MFFTNWHTRLLKRLLFLLIPYSLLRIGFYFYHLNIYKQFTQEEIFESFLLGIRFDIAAIILMNASVILLSLIPSENPKFLKFDRIVFTIANTIGFIIAIDDFELFLFMGKRLSSDLFSVTGDILDQLPQITMHYWYFPLGAIALGLCVYFFDKKFFKLKSEKLRWKAHAFGGILILGLSFIGIRGGLQSKSINVQSAFVQGKNELGHLVLNTPYHFLRTLKNKKIERINFLSNDDEAKNILINVRDFKNGFQNPSKINVVLIILESFSLEYMEKGFTPFLSELAKESLFFDKHLANGRRSIEVLPSVLCGLPSLIDDPLSKSNFSGNKFTCMPKVLKNLGYETAFFHGGTRGTMGFESYTLSKGFDRYYAREDFPGDEYDGTWGIYDEPFMNFSADKISKMKEPFMAGIFTLSSHQPYAVPNKLKGKFPKGTLEIHESIGYTDYAVQEFFKKIKNESWFTNTVFILTADHTQKLETKKFQNMVGKYRVPLLIYSPGKIWMKKDRVSQHADIPKTILDLVGSKEELAMIGSSLFSSDMGTGINYADGSTYFLATQDRLQTIDKSGVEKTYALDWESGDLTPIEGDTKLLKAHVQYFINGLLNNNLSL